jgi:hypothetical protein
VLGYYYSSWTILAKYVDNMEKRRRKLIVKTASIQNRPEWGCGCCLLFLMLAHACCCAASSSLQPIRLATALPTQHRNTKQAPSALPRIQEALQCVARCVVLHQDADIAHFCMTNSALRPSCTLSPHPSAPQTQSKNFEMR